MEWDSKVCLCNEKRGGMIQGKNSIDEIRDRKRGVLL